MKFLFQLFLFAGLALSLADCGWFDLCRKPKGALKFNIKDLSTTKWFVYMRTPKPDDQYKKCMTIDLISKDDDKVVLNFTAKTTNEFYPWQSDLIDVELKKKETNETARRLFALRQGSVRVSNETDEEPATTVLDDDNDMMTTTSELNLNETITVTIDDEEAQATEAANETVSDESTTEAAVIATTTVLVSEDGGEEANETTTVIANTTEEVEMVVTKPTPIDKEEEEPTVFTIKADRESNLLDALNPDHSFYVIDADENFSEYILLFSCQTTLFGLYAEEYAYLLTSELFVDFSFVNKMQRTLAKIRFKGQKMIYVDHDKANCQVI